MKAAAPAVFATLLFPRLAEACPMCASQQPGGVARILALGVMLLLPFSIAFVVFRALRRGCELTTEEGSVGRAAATAADGERAGALREPSL